MKGGLDIVGKEEGMVTGARYSPGGGRCSIANICERRHKWWYG